MKDKLKNVAVITQGFSFRKAINPVSKGKIAVIQGKDFDDNFRLVPHSIIKINAIDGKVIKDQNDVDSILSRYSIQRSNVLFQSRGSRNFAAPVTIDLRKTIATGSIYVIRPDSSKVMHHFLAWWINQPSSQALLKAEAGGSHIPFIPLASLRNLKIELPPLNVQEKVVRLISIHQKEIDLQHKRRVLQAQLINQVLRNAVNHEARYE